MMLVLRGQVIASPVCSTLLCDLLSALSILVTRLAEVSLKSKGVFFCTQVILVAVYVMMIHGITGAHTSLNTRLIHSVFEAYSYLVTSSLYA